jgi:XTP/dITP diphosphohydrolase
VLRGRLTTAPRGTGGFGYDPVLEPDAQPARADHVLTCAELTPEEKNAISHRGQAFRALAPAIADVLG